MLAAELSRPETGRTLYILDEPTTGLHFKDIEQLLGVLRRLTDQGNTVLLIEHNLDVVKCADYVVDMGPDGGENGGVIMAEGTPEEVAESDSVSAPYLAATSSVSVMILGASGRLGRALWESRPQTLEVTALTHAELDVTDIRAVEAVIALARPDVVINAAAWTDVAGAQAEAAPAPGGPL